MAGAISFPGIGSGIDGARIAQAVADQYSLSNDVHRSSIQQLGSESTSLEKLRTFLLDLSDKLEALRTINGGASSKGVSTSNEAVATAAADSTAQLGSFDLTVSSTAASASGSFDRSFAAADEAIISDVEDSGTVSFTVGSGDEEHQFSVAVGPSTTAEDFVSQFNGQAEGLASARLVNLGTEDASEYRIAFSSTELGTEKGSISVAAGNPALFEAGALEGTTIEQATNAVFSISGIAGTFERASNTINDAVSGLSIELHAVGQSKLSVDQSASASASQLESFISSYNTLVEFVNKEDPVELVEQDGEQVNVFGSLSKTSVDENALSTIRNAISEAHSADGGLSLASLGVSTERDGTLSFDREAFEQASAADPERASQALSSLADRLGGPEGVVHQFTGYGLTIDTALKGNETEVNRLNESIARVDRIAQQKEDAVRTQFTSLESLLAKLNVESNYIAGLLQF